MEYSMVGYIYIAGYFDCLHNIFESQLLIQKFKLIDNDPDFRLPFTWGICRPDLREKVKEGDMIFFVLPKNNKHGLEQMIFAYITVKDIIKHKDAYHRSDLECKRMTTNIVTYRPFNSKFSPYLIAQKGNIIVDGNGNYNSLDIDHENNFERIKENYVIADMGNSKLLTLDEMKNLSNNFLDKLLEITNYQNTKGNGIRAIDIISKYGFTLNESQTKKLVDWLS